AGEFPMIEEIKAALYGAGALYASLSGSGSAIYGIFDDDNMAEQARMMFDEFDSYVGRFQQF
ncbi:MAG: 4-(cytidine 5'-diphospho)-2-C-methyl-D-erythritol kinase, partial [Paramuribaculum sp.]|nr:4-(cytidine 5'-diphospho)-2-C-methyl-D-erythritol kinase [Paramuribaculum sp.]